ncbi:hypothetical protein RHSIM_Rhsim02G0041700 [Rhododendron simsii]|uniref:At4g14310 8-bladed propeller domain-containing protein n=1 Tax=Rhododendron simsii TaxID=118357 RepID=A0A834HDP3_RHOSS|nr:hypothetical protein RHSIM_Rhsim02G0041700 [Rhododendron simsii]
MPTRRIAAAVALIFSPTTTARNYPKGNPFLHHYTVLFHTTQFSTNPNPPDVIPITNRQQLQKLLSEKSKTGFDKLDDALCLFHQMARFRPLPSVVHFTLLLSALAKMKEYSSVISLCKEIRELESVSLWDVSALDSQALLSISSYGRKVSARRVNNSDAEPGGGVSQRSSVMKQPRPQVQEFSLRKQMLFGAYSLPESNAHSNYTALMQVWGNSNHVMGVGGLGLFVFYASNDDGLQQSLSTYCSNLQKVPFF